MNRNVLGKYVHGKTGTHYIELRADGECFLFEGDVGITGSYEIKGDEITILGGGSTSHGTIQGNAIIDAEGDAWVLTKEPTTNYSKCRSCNSDVPEASRFCPRCGADQNPTEPAKKKEERNVNPEPVSVDVPENRSDAILHRLTALPLEIIDILFALVLGILVVLAAKG